MLNYQRVFFESLTISNHLRAFEPGSIMLWSPSEEYFCTKQSKHPSTSYFQWIDFLQKKLTPESPMTYSWENLDGLRWRFSQRFDRSEDSTTSESLWLLGDGENPLMGNGALTPLINIPRLVVWNMFSMKSWEWNNHPNWRTPSFFRGVAKNHQPAYKKLLKPP